MGDSIWESEDIRIIEIEQLIREFKEKFRSGTANADEFMTITEIELLWGELQNKTNKIYSDMVRELMSEVDESGLIRKKKRVQPKRRDAQNTYPKQPVSNDYIRENNIPKVLINTQGQSKQRTAA